MTSTGDSEFTGLGNRILRVDTTVAVDEVLRQSIGLECVRIHVPSFTDGRVFSLVRALFESPHFKGAIEVHGDLLPDQVPLLQRYGVHAIELENGMDIEDRPRFITGAWREQRLGSGPGNIKGVKR
jgi:uncharacterized protein (DUF934 family)